MSAHTGDSGIFGNFNRRDDFKTDDFFPVYNQLHSQIASCTDKDCPLSDQEIKILTEKVKQLDNLGMQMIYVFIRLHSLRYSESRLLETPYGGQQMNTTIENSDILSDVKWDLRKFPSMLCRMLDRFATLHLRRMQEEKEKIKNSH